MSVVPKYPLSASGVGSFSVPVPVPITRKLPLGVRLLADGVVAPHAMVQALSGKRHLTEELLSRNLVNEAEFYRALAAHHSVGVADLAKAPLDRELIDRLGAMECLRCGLLPWHRAGAVTVIAASDPAAFAKHLPRLTDLFGPVALCLLPPAQLETAVLRVRGAQMALRSECMVTETESCRNWDSDTSRKVAVCCIALAACFVMAPQIVMTVLLLGSMLFFLATMVLKGLALWLALRRTPAEPEPVALMAQMPTVSLMVALYREAGIVSRLVTRLGRIDYPRHLLDVVLVVEESDRATRVALAEAHLPGWIRVVVAPEGQVKTKPRALNHALAFCRGSIVGVYDAEDAPQPDQIRRVVERFHRRGPQVACLQGILDFYNPGTNWLSRCFTIEYAAWFRVMLPGLQKLGFPIPLGGTTLFFRRDVLCKLGGWDAHNVTEDADLGIRLARHGYRTEMILSTTYEEANCRALPWIKQRSRWIKGYMMTYASHMRDPGLLWRQLGMRQFIGFQVLFLGSISQVLMTPLTLSLWAVALGLPHSLTTSLPAVCMGAIAAMFVIGEAVSMAVGLVGLQKSGHKISKIWVPTLHIYNPLGALASYKALWELMHKPFYWDKTSHGHFDHAA